MPYIIQAQREYLDSAINKLCEQILLTQQNMQCEKDGLLNYTFTKILKECYVNPKYTDFNEMVGVLECCKQELYRKPISVYEDKKELENGPV